MLTGIFRKPTPDWLLWLLFFTIPLNLFAYFNLEVSYKYEVDIAHTLVNIHPSTVALKEQEKHQLRERGREIHEAQFRSLLYAGLAAGTAVGLALRNQRLQPTPATTS
ncbi:hypothetical protein [Hymenobacter perfusus]|uniref:Uncharacterized protein n=1 Tax=Hymenobacter perfusus TaxID=1236770 RepID=A0A428KDX1_9BACT|nr:hypothetical protein [Hymenobacter perfusus]RSK44592.1 hypothetical protein EI293_08740 [Hymenobacter perfusus]